jgi:hypothetical protein
MTTTKKPAGMPEQTAQQTPLAFSASASPHTLLKPSDIESEGGPTVATQYVWASANRHQWKSICLKVGRNLRYRRSDWDAWKESRRMSCLSESKGGK